MEDSLKGRGQGRVSGSREMDQGSEVMGRRKRRTGSRRSIAETLGGRNSEGG